MEASVSLLDGSLGMFGFFFFPNAFFSRMFSLHTLIGKSPCHKPHQSYIFGVWNSYNPSLHPAWASSVRSHTHRGRPMCGTSHPAPLLLAKTSQC